jgi:predicted nucleic acid-binding protein
VKAYLDSSVVVHWILGQRDAVEEWGRWEAGVVSELVEVEVRRCLDRLRVLRQLTPCSGQKTMASRSSS